MKTSNNIWPFRFSSVDAGNIVRLLAPDIGLLFCSIFILRLCIKLLRPVPQVNLHENGIPPADPEVDVKTLNGSLRYLQNARSYRSDCPNRKQRPRTQSLRTAVTQMAPPLTAPMRPRCRFSLARHSLSRS